MSEFHKAFYVNCPIHKDIEYPLWRKCPKCSVVITYTEEALLDFSIWCSINYVRYVEKDGERIWFDPVNIKYHTTKTLLKIWLEKK